MEKTIFIKPAFLLATLPVAIVATFLFVFNRKFRYGCSTVKLRLNKRSLSLYEQKLVQMLVIGEDHRFSSHFGFDPIAIMRATYKTMFCRKLEGASTIEQQLVRTCTGRTEISIPRKIEEILIAVLVSLTTKKVSIAYSYLTIAYFGEGGAGYIFAKNAIAHNQFAQRAGSEELSAIIAMLKYPIPKNPDNKWRVQHTQRANYIYQRFVKNHDGNSVHAMN